MSSNEKENTSQPAETEKASQPAETEKANQPDELPVKAAPSKKKKPLWKKIIGNPLFWLAVSIILLICAIEYFERYTQIGINNTYKIF